MCGIVCYIGYREALPILLEGLKKLEYRGYDSAGISLLSGKSLETIKATGKIAALEEKIKNTPLDGFLGIGHTT